MRARLTLFLPIFWTLLVSVGLVLVTPLQGIFAQSNVGQCETPNLLILLDRSASMLEANKWEQAQEAIDGTFVQFVDNVMVGQLGTAELAAISLGNSFVFIGMSIGIGFSQAITPLIAEADGAKKDKDISGIFEHSFLICIILGIVLFLLVFLNRNLLYSMNQPVEVVELASPYLFWVSFSLISIVTFQSFRQFADGLSFTRAAMYSTDPRRPRTTSKDPESEEKASKGDIRSTL